MTPKVKSCDSIPSALGLLYGLICYRTGTLLQSFQTLNLQSSRQVVMRSQAANGVASGKPRIKISFVLYVRYTEFLARRKDLILSICQQWAYQVHTSMGLRLMDEYVFRPDTKVAV